MKDWNEKKIDLRQKIPFKWMDREHGGRSLGWAYFKVCQVWKRGRIKKLIIYPAQQRSDDYFVYEIPEDYKATEFNLSSYTLNDSEAVITSNSYCNEHKAILSAIRVPKESEYFVLTLHFGNSICMDFHKNYSEADQGEPGSENGK